MATSDTQDGPSAAGDYQAIEREIARHPGYRTHADCAVLKRSIAYVFGPNWQELLALLEKASTDHDLAMELVQNVREPDVRDQFHGVLTRHLHNYVASTMSLVDHVRCIMRTPSGELVPDFQERKAQLLTNPEIGFVQDLRNFMRHRTLPVFAHSVALGRVNTPEQTMTSEVELNVVDLRRWDRWTPTSREFLAGVGEQLVLRPLVQKHGHLVYWFNRRLYEALVAANGAALEEVNALIVRRNAVWANVDLAAAERMTDWGFES